MSVNPDRPDAWIVVKDHRGYGPFLSKIDACDGAMARWGNDADWDVYPLNQTLRYTALVKRESPSSEDEGDPGDPF